MPTVAELADAYIDQMASSNPIEATQWGVRGHDDRLPDLSPAGLEARAELQRRALAALAAVPKDIEMDRIAAEVMSERLAASLELYDAGDDYRSLRVLHSPQGSVRGASI